MTELDLGQKVRARELLWRMGFSTRIDVDLRAADLPYAASGRSNGPEPFTDVDVLGVAVTPSGHVQIAIVDCKTGGSSTISRMFWVRGLVELFGADSAFMVRERAISADAQQLAGKLGIKALTEADVAGLNKRLQTNIPVEGPLLRQLFDKDEVGKVKIVGSQLGKKLRPLMTYRQFDYWVYPEHRQLIALVDALHEAKDELQSGNSVHMGLFLDCVWLYLLSLARCVGALRSSPHVLDLNMALSEYLAGGSLQLVQKHEMAELLKALQEEKQVPGSVSVNVNPRFFEPLLELVMRLQRRGSTINDALRLLEFQSASILTKTRQFAQDAFGGAYDPTAAKLAVDVVEFLVAAAELPQGFANVARTVLSSPPTAE